MASQSSGSNSQQVGMPEVCLHSLPYHNGIVIVSSDLSEISFSGQVPAVLDMGSLLSRVS